MKPRMSFLAYLKPRWKRSCALSAASGKVSPLPPRRAAAKVCLRWTWPSTYLRRPAHPCTSPRSWNVSNPSSVPPWTARAWSPRLPRRSLAATASCARRRIHSHCARRPDEPAGRVPRRRSGLAQRLSPTAHVRAWRATSARFADLSWAPLSDSYHLDQRRPEPQLERGVFSSLALPLGAAGVVSADPATRPGVLPAASGRRGHRRYPAAEDGPRHSPVG